VAPSESVWLLLKCFVVKVAASCRFLSPLASKHNVFAFFKHADFDWLRRENSQGEVALVLFLGHAGHDDERTLSWLIECVQSCNVVVLEVGLLEPLSLGNLQLSLEAVQLGSNELGHFLTLFFFQIGSQFFSVGYSVTRDAGKHFSGLLLLARNNLSGWLSCGAIGLRDHDAYRDALDSSTSFLLENNF
jgi:hypothetical protein